MKKWVIAFGAVLVLGAIGMVFINTPDRIRFPVRGIDVSHHQGSIDWARVAKDDVQFVFLKATEGGDFKDKRFLENVRGAQEAKLPVGAYHFFTLCRPGADQARNFTETLENLELEMPIVVDLEFEGNCSDRPKVKDLKRELEVFFTDVERKRGQKLLIYSMLGFMMQYGDAVPERKMWRRWISIEPFWTSWEFWQYDDDATIDGIEGPVDLNVYFSSKEQFTATYLDQ